VIYVNGRPTATRERPTIRDVLLAADVNPDRTGIAVAVDAEVARRADWPTRTVPDGARVEIVTATQGG
jgi:sulfur carrier protein